MAVAIAACGGAESGADGTDAGSPEGAAPAVASTEGRHLGLFFHDGEPEFESCDGTVMGVDGPVIMELIAMHAELTPGLEPLEAIFVDLWGRVVEDDGPIRMDAIELRRVAYEGGGCSRDDSGVFFRGTGTEPFWSVEVGEEGLVWTTPEETVQMPHSGLYDGPQGEWMFDGLAPDNAPVLTVALVQEPCVDAMSGAWFHLTMKVEYDGRTWNGCSYMAPEAEG